MKGEDGARPAFYNTPGDCDGTIWHHRGSEITKSLAKRIDSAILNTSRIQLAHAVAQLAGVRILLCDARDHYRRDSISTCGTGTWTSRYFGRIPTWTPQNWSPIPMCWNEKFSDTNHSIRELRLCDCQACYLIAKHLDGRVKRFPNCVTRSPGSLKLDLHRLSHDRQSRRSGSELIGELTRVTCLFFRPKPLFRCSSYEIGVVDCEITKLARMLMERSGGQVGSYM
jgi:hypothetical protein